MTFCTILLIVCAVVSQAAQSKGYRLIPSSVQIQDERQRTEVITWDDAPAVVAQIDGVWLLLSPRRDMFTTRWMSIIYIVDNRKDTAHSVAVSASSARAFVADQEIKRYTQAEQLAYLDKGKRSADFWGGISAGLAAMNASRTAGRYDYRGTANGSVTDQYGNRAQVKSQYSGTVVDRAEAQRASTDAAIESSRATYDTMQAMDALSREVLDYSPEQRAAKPGEESLQAYWVFDAPKARRGVTPLRLTVDIGGRHFIYNFDLIR